MSLPPILIFAVILSFGFLCGELAVKLKLPKVTGYILAGVLLNPGVSHVIAPSFADHTAVITNVALSFITFSVGGTLLYPRVRRLGAPIIYITLLEAELAFLFVAAGMLPVMALFVHIPGATWVSTLLPLCVLLACLASPTDPSATLAVVHEYKAHGPVTSTIMGVAAFDDVTGIINYSVAVVVAQALCDGEGIRFSGVFVEPVLNIGGAVLLGIAFGFAFNVATVLLRRETEGALIVVVFGTLAGCFGLAAVLGADELLATMSMGVVVVNYNRKREKIFKMLERYTEEMVFVLFFTLSGMHLTVSVLVANLHLIVFFVLFRSMGKVAGAVLGAAIADAPRKVKKFTAGGLIPQGGIVVGLALLLKQNPAFSGVSNIVLNVVIGATVVHELVGPVLSRLAIQAAGEIHTPETA